MFYIEGTSDKIEVSSLSCLAFLYTWLWKELYLHRSWYVVESFLLKINLRYFHVFLGQRIRPPIWLRSNVRGLNILCDLEKWNISVFLCSIMSPNWSNSNNLIL